MLFCLPLLLTGLASATSLQDTLKKTRLELQNSSEFQLAQQHDDYAGFIETKNGPVMFVKGSAGAVSKQGTNSVQKQAAELKSDIAAMKMPAYKTIQKASVQAVKYSYNDLVTVMGKIRHHNKSKGLVSSLTINTQENKVELTLLKKGTSEQVKGWLQDLGIASDSYLINTKLVFAPMGGKGGSKPVNYGTLGDRQQPFLPGVRTMSEFDNPGSYCSAGYIAAGTFNGNPKYGFVTARHCIRAYTRDQYYSNMFNINFYQPDKSDTFRNKLNSGWVNWPKKGSGLDAIFVPLDVAFELKLPVTDIGGPTIREFKVIRGAYTKQGGYENIGWLRHTGNTSYHKELMKSRDFNRLYPRLIAWPFADYIESPNYHPAEAPFYEVDSTMWCFDYLMGSRDTRYPLIDRGDSGSGVYDLETMTAIGILSTVGQETSNGRVIQQTVCIQDWQSIQRDLMTPVVPAAY